MTAVTLPIPRKILSNQQINNSNVLFDVFYMVEVVTLSRVLLFNALFILIIETYIRSKLKI